MHKLVTYHGLTASIRQWAAFLGLRYHTLAARIRRGWPVEKALEKPLRHKGVGNRTHGSTYRKEYTAWKSMIYRCESSTYWAAPRYSGRGIRVCKRWRNSFPAFLADVGPAPESHFSLGRLDNDGDYRPGNVSWQNAQEQARNRAKPNRKAV